MCCILHDRFCTRPDLPDLQPIKYSWKPQIRALYQLSFTSPLTTIGCADHHTRGFTTSKYYIISWVAMRWRGQLYFWQSHLLSDPLHDQEVWEHRSCKHFSVAWKSQDDHHARRWNAKSDKPWRETSDSNRYTAMNDYWWFSRPLPYR